MVRFSGNMAEALTHLIQVFIFFNKLLSFPVQTFWLVGYRKIVWECRLKLIHRLPQPWIGFGGISFLLAKQDTHL